MRSNIIIFSHNTHSFLKNEIAYASNQFKRVIVVCPPNKELEETMKSMSNVEWIFYTKKQLYKNAIISIPNFIKKDNKLELIDSIQNNIFSFKYLKHYMNFMGLETIFANILKKKVCLSINEDINWVFYSAWYYGTAYSVAMAKKKYKNAKVISLAHSFEVDKEKNPFTTKLFRGLYHNKLDKVIFISKNVYKNYVNEVAIPLNLSLENIEVKYLGTKKMLDGNNKPSFDRTIRIVSCSHMVPIKRLDLIFEALDNFEEEVNIEWTHIGSGIQMNYLKSLVRKKMNKNLVVTFLGALDNIEIHRYYISNTIDIFINTSKSEGIPVSIMEAIAYGIPVIATDVGGNSEIVNDSLGKILAQDPTAVEINKAIKSIVNLPIDEQYQLRKNAMDFFEKNYNSNNIRNDFFKEMSKE